MRCISARRRCSSLGDAAPGGARFAENKLDRDGTGSANRHHITERPRHPELQCGQLIDELLPAIHGRSGTLIPSDANDSRFADKHNAMSRTGVDDPLILRPVPTGKLSQHGVQDCRFVLRRPKHASETTGRTRVGHAKGMAARRTSVAMNTAVVLVSCAFFWRTQFLRGSLGPPRVPL